MIREALEEADRSWRTTGHIFPLRTLILEKGQEFTPAKYRGYGRRKEPQACWSNSLRLATFHEELQYVEGYAISASLIQLRWLTVHAWCVTEKGKVVDPTWKRPEGGLYIGVILPKYEALSYVCKKGYHGVLTDYGGEMMDMEALVQFFPEYANRDWKAEAEASMDPKFRQAKELWKSL